MLCFRKITNVPVGFLAMAIIGFANIGCTPDHQSNLGALAAGRGESDANLIHDIYSMEKDQALAAVAKFAVGTWTSTQAGDFWYRLVVPATGIAQLHMVMPSEDDWGKPEAQGSIEPTTWKDMSTGKRLYGFRLKAKTPSGDEHNAYMTCQLLSDRGTVFCDSVGSKLFLDRGDKFPFSK